MNPARLLTACLSALLMAIAFPKWDIWIAAWFSLVPLLWAIRDRSPREAAILGWTSGTLHYGLLVYWLVRTMQSYGNLPIYLSVAVFFLLIIYMGLYWAVFGALLTYIRSVLGIGFVWIAPPLWCALEALRGVLLTGFPWALLGYSQWRVTSLTQVADITGIYGLSFLIVWVNVAILLVLETVLKIEPRGGRKALVAVGLSILLVGSSLVYGIWRVPRVMSLSDRSPFLHLGIAQGNIEQSLKWDPAFQEATLRIYEDLTEKLARQGSRLVVWPETAAPFFFQIEDAWHARLTDLARKTRTEILFGSPAFGREGDRQTFFNRAYLMGPEGEILGWYDKIHLVPFGEYVPLKDLLFFIHRMVESVGAFSPGKGANTIRSKTGASIGVMICFESIFPEISRALVRNGADILANLTNDAWFGDTSAPFQHLSMLTLRAVENRRWIVRAANTGISGIVDPCGRLRSEISLFQQGVLFDKVPRVRIKSFYLTYGDGFVVACSLWVSGLLVLSVFISLTRRRRRNAFP